MLSELLNVHMEDILVKKNTVPVIYDIEQYLCSGCTETIYSILPIKYTSLWHRWLWTNRLMKILLTNTILLS